MRLTSLALSAILLLPPTAALAQASSSAPISTGGHYTTADTEIGVLLDDPAAKAVIEKDAPEIAKSDQIDMARSMTLRSVQQYSPDELSDAVLAKIDADLAKLPAKAH